MLLQQFTLSDGREGVDVCACSAAAAPAAEEAEAAAGAAPLGVSAWAQRTHARAVTLVHEVLAECCPGARLQPHVLGTEAVAALSADADAVAARAAAPLELVLARRGADPAAAAARARSGVVFGGRWRRVEPLVGEWRDVRIESAHEAAAARGAVRVQRTTRRRTARRVEARLQECDALASAAEAEAAGAGGATVDLSAAAAEGWASAAQHDEHFDGACAYLAAHGFADGYFGSERVEAWLGTAAGADFVADCADRLPRLEASASAEKVSGRELAALIRLVQLQLKEHAPKVHGGMLGQDQLVPLLEPILVAARPVAAWRTLERMAAITDMNPDLDAAMSGWENAAIGIEASAVGRWRDARRRAAFWRALRGSALLRRAACRDGADVPLPTIFEPFLRGSADLEAEVWGAAAAAPQSYVGELGRRTRDELLL